MRVSRFVAAAAAVLALGGASRAEAQFSGNFNAATNDAVGEKFAIEIAGALWNPDPAITIATDALTVTGNNSIDFVGELGVETTRFKDLRVTLKAGRRNKLRFEYTPIKYEAAATLNRTVVFSGRTYTVGLPVNTLVDWKAYRFGYEFDVVSLPRGFVGVLGEVKYNNVSATLSSPIGTETTEQKAPVPTIGGIARGYLTRNLAATFELSGFKLTRDPDEVKWIDYDIYGTLNFTRNIGVLGGYRSLHATYTIDNDAGDLELKGPYLGAVVRF